MSEHRKPVDPETKRQDRALEDTFPASDPLPPGGSDTGSPPHPPREDEVEKDVDDTLDDSFPASDPPSFADPDHPEPTP